MTPNDFARMVAAQSMSHEPDAPFSDPNGDAIESLDNLIGMARQLTAVPQQAQDTQPGSASQVAGNPDPAAVTYKFDMLAVATVDITTAQGETAARAAIDTLQAIDNGWDGTLPPDARWMLTCVATRSRGYLVSAENAAGHKLTDSGEIIPEPIDGEHRDALRDELANAVEALEGDSNDAEHDALYGLAGTVAGVVDAEFNPRSPYDYDDEEETDAPAAT